MVHPDFQGKGLGSELKNKMIEYLKKAGVYMISVLYDEGLKDFYARFGFINCYADNWKLIRVSKSKPADGGLVRSLRSLLSFRQKVTGKTTGALRGMSPARRGSDQRSGRAGEGFPLPLHKSDKTSQEMTGNIWRADLHF